MYYVGGVGCHGVYVKFACSCFICLMIVRSSAVPRVIAGMLLLMVYAAALLTLYMFCINSVIVPMESLSGVLYMALNAVFCPPAVPIFSLNSKACSICSFRFA